MKYLHTLLFTVLLVLSSCQQQEKELTHKILLSESWKIQASNIVNEEGRAISSLDISLDNWYKAEVPSTVMGTLTKNGLYPDLLVGENIKQVDKTLFDSSWWYRGKFHLPRIDKDQHIFLNFDGISYAANIWLNGKLIASKDSIFGPFRRYFLNITPYAKVQNVLAVEIFKAQPGDPNIGFVDWNPRPCDESMGIFREVSIDITGSVKIAKTHVNSKVNLQSLDEAWLTIQTEVENLSENDLSGELVGNIEGRTFSSVVKLKPNEKKLITLRAEDQPVLHIKNPRLWWCNNMGRPELYKLDLKFKTGNAISAQENITFGIRQIETYFTEKGHKGFILNGKKVLIKGAGWTDDIFLRDTPETNEIQVQYVKDMNLNTIRFENIWGTSQNIYDLCDRYGLLALVGWSCHWEWEDYFGEPCDDFGCIKSKEDMELIAKSFEDQVVWFRNHPSIIAWFAGSDMIPRPELEKKYMDILSRTDDRPYVAAAKMHTSELTGSTGMKMAGPYEYVGPNYWYIDSIYGGAYGFNTETGIGAQLPVKESIMKMIPKDKLWPINDVWNFHCTTSGTAMNSLNILTEVVNDKYGEAKDLDDYLMKANVINYDGTKAMFEAFRANMPETTGIVQWMLNSAWPSMYWQLYDSYFIPTPAYYAVKKANIPQQLIYNYKDNSIYAVNESSEILENKMLMQLYSADSKLILKKEMGISVQPGTSKKVCQLDPLTQNTFLSLQIMNKNCEAVADNFYCLSTKQDEYDWSKTNWVHTPTKAYADFKYLNNIPQSELKINSVRNKTNGESEITLEIDNTSPVVSYFLHFSLKDENGDILYPVFWSDNYLSLLPQVKRVIKCQVKESLLNQKQVKIFVKGWNFNEKEISLSRA